MKPHKGQRLKVARKAAGLNQYQLGERLHVDQAFISRLEHGTNDGTVSFWCDAAKLLGVSVDYLLLDEPVAASQQRGKPLRMNKMAVLADYTLARGLREVAMDHALAEVLAITDDEWTQLAAISLPPTVTKDGILALLFTLRTISQSAEDAGDAS